ncbi:MULTISPECIES: trimeric intracellular cation channel family protein [Catenuloplanes]|uniref:Membrane protein YeiH n=1 Tax=Catenuloplanes niger TaxID=587534 RepID=A0AAE4CVB9_9ACTN|nr:TRIC cation channel family protein [Catenuloplanes niger]MDR7327161.1 putative membrane protein YeiH [Catenuloplanes niger]
MLSYVLDLTGVFAFGSYGAYQALRVRMNYFGVFVCAGLVAMGGGTVREVILHGTPAYIADYRYVAVVTVAAATVVVVFPHFHRVEPGLAVLDAVGTGAFALFGAIRAAESGLGLGGMMLCGTLTAVGGGVICDLLAGHRSRLFWNDSVMVPVLLTTVLAWLLRAHLSSPPLVASLVVLAAVVRIATVRWNLQLRPAAARWHRRTDSVDETSVHRTNGSPWNDVTVPLPVARDRTPR